MPNLIHITTKAKAKKWLVDQDLISDCDSKYNVEHKALFSALEYKIPLASARRTVERLKLRQGVDFIFVTGAKATRHYQFTERAATNIVWQASMLPRNRKPDLDTPVVTVNAPAVLDSSSHADSKPLMSSVEIATLTGKEHKHVMRDIRNMLKDLEQSPSLDFVCKSATYHSNGQSYNCFELDKDMTECLLTGYSPVLRMKVIKRWRDLESQQTNDVALPDFSNPVIAARAWADEAEKVQTLQIDNKESQELISVMQEKADFVDSYVEARGSFSFREVANILQAKEKEFVAWLIEKKIVYRLNRNLTAFQNHVEAGRFVSKTGMANGHAIKRSLFTPKGLAWITKLWSKR